MVHFPDLFAVLANCIWGQQISIEGADYPFGTAAGSKFGEVTSEAMAAFDDAAAAGGISCLSQGGLHHGAAARAAGEVISRGWLLSHPDDEVCRTPSVLLGIGVDGRDAHDVLDAATNILSWGDLATSIAAYGAIDPSASRPSCSAKYCCRYTPTAWWPASSMEVRAAF